MNPRELKSFYSELISKTLGFRGARVITTAVKLNLFQRIGDTAKRLQNFRKENEDPEALRRICDYLSGLNLLQKQDQQYACTPEARELLTDQGTHDVRPVFQLYHRAYERWGELDRAVLEGQSIDFESDQKNWSSDFIAAMEARATFSRESISDVLKEDLEDGKIMDLGGGSGVFTRALLQKCPEARGVIADLPHVLSEAQTYIKKDSLEERIDVRELDLLESEQYGSGFQMIFVSAILHIFGPEQNKQILSRACDALAKNGRIVIRDYILNPDKTSPESAALFNLHMFLATENGAVYTEQQYRTWLKGAGFSKIQRRTLEETSDLLIGRK